ncbi:MAG: Ig-like domain-containing protein [Planctomycetota bacterium]|nr:Ig-like domain-containing protein [Planctomycetota bacterium]
MSSKSQRRSALRRLFRHVEHLESRHLLAGFFVDFSVLEPTDYTQSEVVVRFNDDVDVPSLTPINLVEQRGVDNAYLSGPLGEGFRSDQQLFEIPVLPGQSVEELVEYYNGLEIIDFAEPNYRMESAAVPNDQFYGVLWGMENINAPSAWDTRTDSSSIVVGVIDSGVEYTHPDLVDNIWTNTGEIAGNGIDDDGNGFVDDFYGWDFENDDNDPTDTNGHGTHVAGTIGAKGNNSIGVTGVGWNASLMSLKVIGTGTNADVARAIDYATDNGAKITNNSYGYAGTNVGGSRVISSAIGRAKNAGVLYVVAAGNSRSNIPASDMDGNFNSWPAEYSKVHDNVITVAAIDEGGAFASYSHWGDQSVQIAAPGTQIGSTYTQGGYVYSSGTSMAAPHVAGAAALLWAEQPSFTYLQIKDAILDNTRAEHLDRVGNGVLDLGAAMAAIAGGQNGAPTANDDTATVDEDNSIGISVLGNDSDPDGDILTVASFTNPSNGSVSNSNNVLTYTPNVNYNGSDSFTYTINDGNNNTATATVNVTINAVNDNPVANNDSVFTNENAAVSINVLSNDTDVDGDSLFVSALTNGSNGSVSNNNNGTVTYTPNNGFFGTDTFTYTVSDGVATDTATVTVTVNEVNDPPTANNDSATVNEDNSVAISVLSNDSDPDGDTLTVSSFTNPINGSVSNSNNVLTYTPNANYNGSDSFTYTINDGNGNNATATVNVTVNAVNDNPVANNDSATTLENTAVSVNVVANDNDVDGDALSVSGVSNPLNGSVTNNSDGTVTYTPNNGYVGSDTFTYTISDGSLTATATVSVTVNGVNDPPTAVNDSADVNEDSSVAVSVLNNDSDPDGDALTVDAFTNPSNGLVSNSNNVLTYTPNANYNGNDSFTYTISDGNGGSATATVNVTVAAVNDNPVAVNDSATTDQDNAITISVLANDTDIDGDSLSVSSATNPSNGTATVNNDGTITYSPAAGFFGSDSFNYTISDGAATDTATVNVTVNQASSGTTDIGVAGTAIDVTHVWKTVNLPMSFNNPVVVAGGSTRDGGHQGVVRVQNITSNSFQIRFQEWDYRDGNHTTENIGYLVVEAGTHTLADGTQIVADKVDLTNETFQTVTFGSSFSSAPLVIAQVQTVNDSAAVVERLRNINGDNFQMQMQEEEAADGIHATESVGYVAIDLGTGTSGDVFMNAVVSGDTVTHRDTTINFGSIGGSSSPVILSDMQKRDGRDTATVRHRAQTSTSVTVFIEEEASRDRELRHTTEVVGVLALESGTLVAESSKSFSYFGRGGDRGGSGEFDGMAAMQFAGIMLAGAHDRFEQSEQDAGVQADGALTDGLIEDADGMETTESATSPRYQVDFLTSAPADSPVSTDSVFGQLEDEELRWWQL